MWLSKRIVQETPEFEPATLGTVSIGGEDAAVVTDGEKRHARVISPGGYCWQPGEQDSVLVIKGNELYVPGVLQDGGRAAPGEVVIYSGASEVRLKSGGTIEIRGRVEITGEAYVYGRKVVTE